MKWLILLMLVAGALTAVSATPPPNNTPPPAPIINIDLTPLTNAITALPNQIISGFYTYTVSGLTSASATLVDDTFKFIFTSPNPNWFCGQFNGVMSILDSLYALVLMGLSLFLILRSGDVEGRLTARKWLENMLVMAVVLAFSFQIFTMMLDFNTYLSTNLASQSAAAIFKTNTVVGAPVLMLVLMIAGIGLEILTFLTLILRYLLLPFMLLFFPGAIFLYFIPATQRWGKSFLTIIIVFIFMTTADAMVLMGLSAIFGNSDPNLADSLVRTFALLFGFAAMGVVNLILIIMAILSIVLQSNAVSTGAKLALVAGTMGGGAAAAV